ncbi:hypothetical protein BDW62DRAFT_202660 [Aspergillus aurantiobrunneus]
MDLDNVTRWLSNPQATEPRLIQVFSQYLDVSEAAQILEQFQRSWINNGQVLWSGIAFNKVQAWAANHRLQTLTTAMGPLMDKNHPACLKSRKTPHGWSRYIHGASAVFAWRIARFESVVLLTPPPPQRGHPSGLTYYQALEEPIIKGRLGDCAVEHITNVHPTVAEGREFQYEIWPADDSARWIREYGLQHAMPKWRSIREDRDRLRLRELVENSGKHQRVKENKISLSELFTVVLWLLVLLIFVLMDMIFVLVCKALQGNEVDQNCVLEQRQKCAERPVWVVEAQNVANAEEKAKSKAQKKADIKAQKKADIKAQQRAQQQARKREKRARTGARKKQRKSAQK